MFVLRGSYSHGVLIVSYLWSSKFIKFSLKLCFIEFYFLRVQVYVTSLDFASFDLKESVRIVNIYIYIIENYLRIIMIYSILYHRLRSSYELTYSALKV